MTELLGFIPYPLPPMTKAILRTYALLGVFFALGSVLEAYLLRRVLTRRANAMGNTSASFQDALENFRLEMHIYWVWTFSGWLLAWPVMLYQRSQERWDYFLLFRAREATVERAHALAIKEITTYLFYGNHTKALARVKKILRFGS